MGATPVPGPTRTRGVAGSGGRRSAPRCVQAGSSSPGRSPASQALQRPRRRRLKGVTQPTTARVRCAAPGCARGEEAMEKARGARRGTAVSSQPRSGRAEGKSWSTSSTVRPVSRT